MYITLEEAARAAHGKYKGDGKAVVKGLFTDSRTPCGDGLYSALIGERVDGHKFVPELNAKGYHCIVSEEEYFNENNILVENTEKALCEIAGYWKEKALYDLKVIAVTGSVGKTTTKDLCGLVFASEHKTFVSGGNRNSVIGSPMLVCSIEKDEYEYAVLEMGMSLRGEISRLSNMARPYLSVITCVGTSHMEYLGSRENIRAEKFDITVGERDDGYLVTDGDSDAEYAMRDKVKQKVMFCGFSERCDFRAENVDFDGRNTNYDIVYPSGRISVSLPAEGLHTVKDSLYAFAAGVLCGISPENAAKAFENFVPTGNRQRIYEKNGVTVIADCYNAAPESMKASLSVLASKAGRKIAVLGDMLELGDNTLNYHEEVASCAADIADVVLFVGENWEKKQRKCVSRYFSIEEKSQAASFIKSIVQNGDVMLFKGSNRIGLDETIKEAGL